MEFQAMPKMPRLSREVVVTEKIDGTNASIMIEDDLEHAIGGPPWAIPIEVPQEGTTFWLSAGSRTRWVTPEDDNYGWAAWVRDHGEQLAALGPGHHFGEWWGRGINRGYGLEERRFSLFNVGRWADPHGEVKTLGIVPGYPTATAPLCCHVVPVIYRGDFDLAQVEHCLEGLKLNGSAAALGFMAPEGVVVYHTAANLCFKKTIKGDEAGKSYENHEKKVRPPRPPKDPGRGGRRVAQVEIAFPGRRKGDSQ